MKTPFSLHRTFGSMKKNAFLFIVLINSAALIGILFTQIYWIREAYTLLDEQFNNTVRITLKGVVNQMLEYELNHSEHITFTNQDSLSDHAPEVGRINTRLLKFKIEEEFKCMQVGGYYEYAIIDDRDNSFLTGNPDQFREELISSGNTVNLTGFKDSGHYFLSAYFPGHRKEIFKKLFDWIIISSLFSLVLIIGFPVSLYIFNRQKRISGMKSDFINNMTHEFKTPIATISLASEMLQKKPVQEDPDKLNRYVGIIYDENIRLQHHVEQILSVSMLERGQYKLKKKETDIHKLISEAVDKFSLTVKDKEGQIRTHYCANNFIMNVDPGHLTNVINNLLDNANKYSMGKPWIRIGTQSTENGLTITVEDKGIGISVENQRMVFRNLYRVSTGNIYNVKGFGIGLYYVKTIVEAHGGHINLKSELEKGSRFDVYLPFDFKSSNDDKNDQT